MSRARSARTGQLGPARAAATTSRTTSRDRAKRMVWVLPAGVCLLAGLDAALLRLGLSAPIDSSQLADRHGPLMVFGFLSTLICLERAVALRRPWAFAGPGLLGAGGICLILPLHLITAQILIIAGWVATIAIYTGLWQRQRDPSTSIELLGAVLGLGGALLWLWVDLPTVLPWIAGFVVATIAAERVELARLAMPATAGRNLLIAGTCLTLSVLAATLWPQVGARLLGLTLLVVVAWLVRHDVARKTIRSKGLAQFSAAALLAGYVWLTVSAMAWLVGGAPNDERSYDVAVHGVFLGFAMSMVMAHAPVIMPAVLRRPLPFRAWMWLPLAVLQLGLIVRLLAGGVFGVMNAWLIGSVVTLIALLLFLLVAIVSAATAERARPRAAARPDKRAVVT